MSAQPTRRSSPYYWAMIADLRSLEDANRIECQSVLSGRWKSLGDPYWDNCVIQVRWRLKDSS